MIETIRIEFALKGHGISRAVEPSSGNVRPLGPEGWGSTADTSPAAKAGTFLCQYFGMTEVVPFQDICQSRFDCPGVWGEIRPLRRFQHLS
jgi:hypothetical protein